MEPVEILKALGRDVFYIVTNHPVYFFFGLVLLFLLLVKFYCRLTLGMCDCDEDMSGKTVIITGGNAGVGKGTALDLARRNARVIIACRSMEIGTKALRDIISATGNSQVVLKHLNLDSFASVREFADDIIKTEPRLDVLINNAGILMSDKSLTEDGWNTIMQSNHLGHFLLTHLLLDLLKRSSPSRIINVSSNSYKHGVVDPDDLKCEKVSNFFRIYSDTKLANVLFTRELSQRLSGTDVTVNASHPGAVRTEIFQPASRLIAYLARISFFVTGKSALEGAQTSIHLAVSPALRGTTGKYFSDCKEEELTERAKDKDLARRLWRSSSLAVGLPEVAKAE